MVAGMGLVAISMAGCIDFEYSMDTRVRTQAPTFATAYFNAEQPVIVPVEAYKAPKKDGNKPVDPNEVETKVRPLPEKAPNKTRFAKFTGGTK